MAESADAALQIPSNFLRNDPLRRLSRSPHPYQRQQADLIQSADHYTNHSLRVAQTTLESEGDDYDHAGGSAQRRFRTPSTTNSDSGTDADDEHYLKGLPAPRMKPHKGVRGIDSPSSSPSPLLSPMPSEGDVKRLSNTSKRLVVPSRSGTEEGLKPSAEKLRRMRKIEILRRITEVLILGVVGALLLSHDATRKALVVWMKELSCETTITAALIVLYPFHVLGFKSKKGSSSFSIPAAFDPAPLLYPPVLPIYVALALSPLNPVALLPNIILSVAALPSQLMPNIELAGGRWGSQHWHWMCSCLPLFQARLNGNLVRPEVIAAGLDQETLSCLFPLHQNLCACLHYLTTTSLLPAELQLLSISLINLLLLAQSPQATILQSLLWIGGVGIFVTCGHVLKWGLALARVPKWRFRRSGIQGKGRGALRVLYSWATFVLGKASCESDDEFSRPLLHPSLKPEIPYMDDFFDSTPEVRSDAPFEPPRYGDTFPLIEGSSRDAVPISKGRRHTLPIIASTPRRSGKTTPSGRRKRAASSSIRSFFALTPGQATFRKWLYAGYVYAWVAGIILVGVRTHVSNAALHGQEPVGWALGYVFGGLPWFRMEVLKLNLERWICLPPRPSQDEEHASCSLGWVEHVRHATFGPANTRLILGAYWIGILITGLMIVFRLSAIYEVDTRRKVFHFMMVAILLPSTFVDPTFAALALALILAIFLLLDLFRATQLPPLSQPLAAFLAPYVDGRDLRGPVVISHIFLLIGCAIPLWLSLGALPRTGEDFAAGWEVPTRDVSMVSGVICVGMGDAAASLVGRRWGRRKWVWGGGKSIEGSVAFALAVASALLVAKFWLRIGGWPETLGHGLQDSWTLVVGKALMAATVASLTEAVLTGGNDNVVVPVVLWLCVKGLGL